MEDKTSVLIVDDNASFCKTISLVLKRKGYAVTTATGGQEAVNKVEKRPFDMIFIDIKMPEMNGVETYRVIKKIRPEMAVVMMTAYAVDDLIQEALEEGAYGIIHKPLDIDEAIGFLEWTKEAKKRGIVLVVDDDDGTCVTFRKILSRRGFKVSIVHSGEEAIAMMKEKAHDILFIDMKLPNKHGLETYLAIKNINPDAVAIMMTAYPREMGGLLEEALDNNAYAYLDKPLDMEKVLKLVEEISEERIQKKR